MMPLGLQVYLVVTPVDMRCSFDGLARVVASRVAEADLRRQLFVFVNRRRDFAKLLWRDATGFCLLAKRLDQNLIRLPANIGADVATLTLTPRALATLLDGVPRRAPSARAIVHEAKRVAENF
jgi:transposase